MSDVEHDLIMQQDWTTELILIDDITGRLNLEYCQISKLSDRAVDYTMRNIFRKIVIV